MVDVRFSFVWIFGGVVACGGSASETPPPLEPDPHAFLRPRGPIASESAPTAVEPDEPLPSREAPPTWGSGNKRSPIVRDYRQSIDGG